MKQFAGRFAITYKSLLPTFVFAFVNRGTTFTGTEDSITHSYPQPWAIIFHMKFLSISLVKGHILYAAEKAGVQNNNMMVKKLYGTYKSFIYWIDLTLDWFKTCINSYKASELSV